jgi:hypothetical protein
MFVSSIYLGVSYAAEVNKKIDMSIDVNKEDREVELKRLELIDEYLSPETLKRKRSMVSSVEADYNRKIMEILNSIIAPVFEHKVVTHMDVNFFSRDFESEVNANQKVSTLIILRRDGFNTWEEQNHSEQEALDKMKQVIGKTFAIPIENISILLIN